VADKITVYVDSDLHRRIKTAASARGMTLSDFMVTAVRHAMQAPDRRQVAQVMDRVRAAAIGVTDTAERRRMRDEGRYR